MLFKDVTNSEEAFLHFMNNCTFKFYIAGNNGVTIIAKLNDNIQSHYKYINSYNFNKDVDKLLLKLVLINKDKNNDDDDDDTTNCSNSNKEFKLDDKSSLDFASKEEFMHEVNTHIDIYLKTMQYLQPICPPICYANIYEYNNKNKLFLHKILRNNLSLLGIYINYGKAFDSIGLIAMEFAENFKQLFNLMPYKNYEIYKNMSRYLLLRLAIETEYNHSDFHKYNILINQDENTYFDSLFGYPLLIDFSWAQKIPLDKLEIIKKYYNEKKYIEALDILYKMKRRDDIDLEEHDIFNWMSKNVISINKREKINNEIDNLINLRNTAIENMKKHSTLIPLNDIFKKYMFIGFT